MLFQVSLLPLVPPVVIYLAKSPLVAKYDLSSVRRVWCAAAPLDKDTEKKFKQRLKIDTLVQGSAPENILPFGINRIKWYLFYIVINQNSQTHRFIKLKTHIANI